MYDPQTARWLTQDPLAQKYYPHSPYSFSGNNPVLYVDSDGRDIYRYDKDTGEFILFKETDDKYDQVGKFKKDKKSGQYKLKANWKGNIKVSINNIEKGILSNGANFLLNAYAWPTEIVSVEGFQNFIVQYSDMIGVEMAGYYYAYNNSDEISYIHMGRGLNNKYNKSYSTPLIFSIRPDLLGKIYPHTQWHTHPSFSDSRDKPSDDDLDSKMKGIEHGIKHFIILTGHPTNQIEF